MERIATSIEKMNIPYGMKERMRVFIESPTPEQLEEARKSFEELRSRK